MNRIFLIVKLVLYYKVKDQFLWKCYFSCNFLTFIICGFVQWQCIVKCFFFPHNQLSIHCNSQTRRNCYIRSIRKTCHNKTKHNTQHHHALKTFQQYFYWRLHNHNLKLKVEIICAREKELLFCTYEMLLSVHFALSVSTGLYHQAYSCTLP